MACEVLMKKIWGKYGRIQVAYSTSRAVCVPFTVALIWWQIFFLMHSSDCLLFSLLAEIFGLQCERMKLVSGSESVLITTHVHLCHMLRHWHISPQNIFCSDRTPAMEYHLFPIWKGKSYFPHALKKQLETLLFWQLQSFRNVNLTKKNDKKRWNLNY